MGNGTVLSERRVRKGTLPPGESKPVVWRQRGRLTILWYRTWTLVVRWTQPHGRLVIHNVPRPDRPCPDGCPVSLEDVIMALRKVDPAGLTRTRQVTPDDVTELPNLWEYLSATSYPDGTARETATLIVLADDGGWRGCVSDKDNSRTMWKTGPTLSDLLYALEEALERDDPGEWRKAVGQGSGKGGRKK